jgi:isoaspartyl peptidase/L-asparaginase-like protein (Ntn-hydrolase superfamily)
MSYEGIVSAIPLLKKKDCCGNAVVKAVSVVEDYPYYKSVGYGGLPNCDGIVELDAAFMNGQTLSIGAVAATHNIKNPIKVAQKLSNENFNNVLVGCGADSYAKKHKFSFKNMLSPRAKQTYLKKLKLLKLNPKLSPYDGHDTVGIITLDTNGNMFAGVSSSGLFMKLPGRVGDSPFPGCGYYADQAIGGATATGLGEDIMKGCLSYLTVQYMKTMSPTKAAQKTVSEFTKDLKKRFGKCGPISIVALDKNGNYGVGTNVEFSFVAANHTQKPIVYLAKPNKDKVLIEVASQK